MRLRGPLVRAALALSLAVIPAQATFPGENGKIVFVGNQSGTWQLYTINPDGSDIRQITNLPPTKLELWTPAFSPDGRRILFAHDTAKNPCSAGMFPATGCVDLYVINADGSGLIRLTDDGLSWLGKWSPDGTSITFGHISPLTNEVIVATMKIATSGEATELTNKFWLSFLPVYTPDGNRIAFGSQLDGLVSAVWVMNPDGSDKDRLTPAPLEGVPSDVSPDGRRILVVDHENTPIPSSIYVMALNGSDLRRLTRPGNSTDLQAGYSPDGKKIVFVSNRLSSDSSLDLFTMNADGSNITRIASGLTVGGCPDENCVGPSWGPKPKK